MGQDLGRWSVAEGRGATTTPLGPGSRPNP